MATALLGLDHIRFAVNHLVGDAVGGAAQQAFDTHDIPHRGAQGAGAQEGIVRLGPAQPPNSLSAHYRTPDRHCRSRAASQAPSPALSVGFDSCRQWPSQSERISHLAICKAGIAAPDRPAGASPGAM